MRDFIDSFDQTFLGNTLGDWLYAGAVFIAIFLIVEFLRGMARSRLAKWRQARSAPLELLGGFAARTSRLVVISVALFFAEKLLKLPPKADSVFEVVIVAGVAVQLALWATTALRFGIERHYRHEGSSESSAGAIGVLMFVGGVVIWDDYGSFQCEGVATLGRELFAADLTVGRLVHNINGHLLLFKLADGPLPALPVSV